jgi:hypothetical protein
MQAVLQAEELRALKAQRVAKTGRSRPFLHIVGVINFNLHVRLNVAACCQLFHLMVFWNSDQKGKSTDQGIARRFAFAQSDLAIGWSAVETIRRM